MKTPELGSWLHRFFREYLLAQRNVSPATIAAYRDTFRLLLRFLHKTNRGDCYSLPLEVLKANTILRFLDHLEQKRGNSIRTRNARLAAIRSFVHYLEDWLGPELPPQVAKLLGIPFKRHAQRLVGFLNRQEIDAILHAADDTWTGQRDHLLFLRLVSRICG
jgi:site-specific recombinase XerD